MNWQLISNHAVHLRRWDDEFVVYNVLSGGTHLLGPAAADILINLQRAPIAMPTLVEQLCQSWQVEPTEELTLQIQEILADLKALELIEEAA